MTLKSTELNLMVRENYFGRNCSYIVFTFKSEGAFPAELQRLANIDETVMRCMVIKLEYDAAEAATKKAAAAQAAALAAEAAAKAAAEAAAAEAAETEAAEPAVDAE